jgi:hypothetical protein
VKFLSSFVIPTEAINLTFFSWAWAEERFLASPGVSKQASFFVAWLVLNMTKAATNE